ncbi:helix-turn-helix domain-containing protein [Zhouia spongiae]|uniref:Helix-turn-helix domain-containing protein n=1 Tax=Zhouia spongiae TaxID=2202721 RepID=A0ABY3YMW1_9FLAO|nr:helix-turn-helix domain-containing protein [Zhouia spongiae]UNY98841.1 helix-turn-helix domain-containing protein [Zhouia spongiae]
MLTVELKQAKSFNIPRYVVLFLKEEAKFSVNFVSYKAKRNSILFLSPYQNLKWEGNYSSEVRQIEFHGDFYCIEYHKKEVSCNGLLFNNIYLQPYILLDEVTFTEIEGLTGKMARENLSDKRFSDSVVKSYLQLILAICSKEKILQIDNSLIQKPFNSQILSFRGLLEKHFIHQRSASFYACALSMSTSSFSKKIKQQFEKTPTQLIQERVVLEAKKLLHLTHKTVKEIAAELNFDDEHYFSRYFKREVGLSPTQFREEVGISIVAK